MEGREDLLITEQTDCCTLLAQLRQVGNDWLVLLTGGEAHIGSISAADVEICDTIIFHGHRDDALSSFFAREMQIELQCHIVVICGIHVNEAESEDIEKILAAGKTLLQRCITAMKAKRSYNFANI